MIKSLKSCVSIAVVALAVASTGMPTAFAGHHPQKADIVSTAASVDDFSTLVAAVKAAGLVDVLKGDGPYTVFAPTNEAFAQLPHGTVDALLKPENKETLIRILTFHVVPGTLKASDLLGQSLTTETASGAPVRIDGTGGEVRVDTARVIKADITTSNGIIHVIDRVIQPN